MNTTSMEFVIAQNAIGKNPSVLSEFMGISKNMEDALLVNPWNLGVRFSLLALKSILDLDTFFPFQDVAAAINRGLLMDPEEKAARHEKLYKVVTTHTSHTWAAVLVKMILGQLGLQGTARQTPYIPKELLEGLYIKAKKRLFLFDYDVRLSLRFFRIYLLLTYENVVGYPLTDREDPIDGHALRCDTRSPGETLDGPAKLGIHYFRARRRVPRATLGTLEERGLLGGAWWIRA